MRLYPTPASVHLALCGVAVACAGLLAGSGAVVGWGVAVVLGVAVARGSTLVSVARVRAAGFEMVWRTARRRVRVARGGEVTLSAELRNRDSLAARFVSLRPVASGLLEVRVEPSEGEVPASGSLKVKLRVRAPRVGRHGVFGLALEVRGVPGLFEVPLTFANPLGVEVLPAPLFVSLRSPLGGRSRRGLDGLRSGRGRGDGDELRELRDHRPGDPFKRIAWRASARRGKLLVREYEQEQRDTAWVVLDGSVELWAGPPGTAPLDLLVDEAAALVSQHLRLGDRVGLAVVASRVLEWVPPARGPAHGSKLLEALAHGASTYDRDRSDLDEQEVALRVLEHLRPLDARGLSDVRRSDLERLAQRATALTAKAPFAAPLPRGGSASERALRHYLYAFGVESPPRSEPERVASDAALVQALARIAGERPRPTLVYVASPTPEIVSYPLAAAIRKLGRGGVTLRWVPAYVEPSLRAVDDGRPEAAALVRAMATRARHERERGERALSRLGVRMQAARARQGPPKAGATSLAGGEPARPGRRAGGRPA
jgi:uncharacterized protein (DUF58 family)